MEEITNVFQNYFKDADSLIAKYEFGCLKHDDYRFTEIVRKPEFNVHGSGFMNFNTSRIDYTLSSTILWETRCKCGDIAVVGFIIEYDTSEWEEIKRKLSQEILSEKNMVNKISLGNKSSIKFVHFAEYRKKRGSLEENTPYPTFSQNCKFYPPFTNPQ